MPEVSFPENKQRAILTLVADAPNTILAKNTKTGSVFILGRESVCLGGGRISCKQSGVNVWYHQTARCLFLRCPVMHCPWKTKSQRHQGTTFLNMQLLGRITVRNTTPCLLGLALAPRMPDAASSTFDLHIPRCKPAGLRGPLKKTSLCNNHGSEQEALARLLSSSKDFLLEKG